MIELLQLSQLITIAEQGTISKAAERLHLSQPALSRSMQRLEHELGVTLFERKKNQVSLNETGKLVVSYGRQLLNDVAHITDHVQSFYRSQQLLSIGSCAPVPMTRCLSQLTAFYPDRALAGEMKDFETLERGLSSGLYQIVILPYPIASEEVYAVPFCEEHLSVAVLPEHPLSDRAEGVYLRELDGVTMLLYAHIGFWEQLCQREMPNARFLTQTDRQAFVELSNASSFPTFTTDIGAADYPVTTGRIKIPILDEDANPTFWCNLLKKNRTSLEVFLTNLDDDL